MRLLIRLIMGSLVAMMVIVAIVPILVLRDLSSGGTGWGLCEQGLSRCSISYFASFELIGVLLIVLFGLLGLYRVALKVLRWNEHQYDRRRSLRDRPMPDADPLMVGPSHEWTPEELESS
mgnify:CR=1 FL=1